MKNQSFLPVLAKNIAIVSLAFLGGFYFTTFFHEPTSLIGGLWAVVSAIIVIEATHIETYNSAKMRIIGTFIGAVISGFYLWLFPFSLLGFVATISIGVIICYILRIPKAVKLTGITISVIIIVSTIDKELHPFVNSGLRLAESTIGTGMAILVAYLAHLLGSPNSIRS